jgi:hypothetical protein
MTIKENNYLISLCKQYSSCSDERTLKISKLTKQQKNFTFLNEIDHPAHTILEILWPQQLSIFTIVNFIFWKYEAC